MYPHLIYRELVLPYVCTLAPSQFCQICLFDIDLTGHSHRWVPYFLMSDTVFRHLRPYARTRHWFVCLVCREREDRYGFELMEDDFLSGHS